MNDNNVGRKIIFVKPPLWIKDEFLTELIENEYEAYVLEDYQFLFPLLQKIDDVILFINIDEGPKFEEWRKYIVEIRKQKGAGNTRIGVLSTNSSVELVKVFMQDLKVEGGFIILRQRLDDIKKTIFKTLKRLEAKGRRRFLRVTCGSEGSAKFNCEIKGKMQPGEIRDVSSAGMACIFNDQSVSLELKQQLEDIQVNLHGKIATLSGTVVGIRRDSKNVYVILFSNRTANMVKAKIYEFIYRSLKNYMRTTLETLKAD